MKALIIAILASAAFACASAPAPAPADHCTLENVTDLSGNGVIDLPDVVLCVEAL